MNIQLIESLVQLIKSLPSVEQALLEKKLYQDVPYPSTLEVTHLAEKGGAFDFLHNEPDIYTLEDGEPI
jgi:hypothetical protein